MSENNTLYTFLRKNQLFDNLTSPDLMSLAAYFTTLTLPAGTVLIEEGQIGRDLYLVLHGRLKIFKKENEHEVELAELGAGEVVGEIGLLIDIPRTATVVTIRDTVLLKLDKQTFESFSEKHPLVSLQVAKKCIQRLTEKKEKNKVGVIKTIAVVPVSKSKIIVDFIDHIAQSRANVLPLDSKTIAKRFPLIENNPSLVSWLNDQELEYDVIFYIADVEDTPWTGLCLRQADAIFFLCDADHQFKMTDPKRTFFWHRTHTKSKSLLLLHEQKKQCYTGTSKWMERSKIDECYHILPYDKSEMEKAIRIMTGTCLGLVLSGGGGRGAAHIGLLKALEESKIPIDIIGGSSIGGIIAALYSLGYDAKAMEEKFHEIIVRGSQLDYTYPYVAFSYGQNLVNALKTYCGENQMIEDLWVKMFCVSANITKNTPIVHKKGLLWRALRSSASLPGVYPPVFDDDGLLVDGGYINNLPVDIAKHEFPVSKTVASLITVSSETVDFSPRGEVFSGWQVLWDRLNPWSEGRVKVPRLDTILMRTLSVNDYDAQLDRATLADYPVYLDMDQFGLMDYKIYKEIIMEGYKQTKQQLEKMSLK